MDDKIKESGKLKLRNTDTNRFKVDTGRVRVQPTYAPLSEAGKHDAGETQQSNTFIDPISLRDTSTSKLKRLDGPGAVGTTVTPASATPEKKSETVRLKVVRATPRPGTLPPSAAPLANVPLSASQERVTKEAPPAPAAETAAPAVKLSVPQIKLPSQESIKPGATTNIAAEYPQEPIVGDQVPPSAAKISLAVPKISVEAPAKEAAEAPKVVVPLPAVKAETPPAPAAAQQEVQPAPAPAPAEAVKMPAEPLASSTIKLSIKKPTGVPLPSSAPSSQPPAAQQAAADPAAPAAPKLPSTATTGLKIRPSATSGSTVVTPPPAVDSDKTAQVAAPPAAGATVKVSPSALMPPSTGAKISLKKDVSTPPPPAEAPPTAPPEAEAEAAPATPSSSTVLVKAPPTEGPASGKKGLRLSSKAGKTVSVPAPDSAAAKPEGEQAPAVATAPEEAAKAAVITKQQAATTGIGMLETISAVAATIALAVTLFSMVMSLLKQM